MRYALAVLVLAGCGGTEEEPYRSCWANHPNNWRQACDAEVKCSTYRAADPECKAIH